MPPARSTTFFLADVQTVPIALGSTFTGRYRWHDRGKGEIVPTITGRAHVTAESALRLDPDDPFRWGIVPG